MSIRREELEAGQVDFSGILATGRRAMKPLRPGDVLKHEFLNPMGLSAYRLAKDIGVPLTRIMAILNGRRSISADTALRLARYFRTDAQSWLNLQARHDLETAKREHGKRIDREVNPRAA